MIVDEEVILARFIGAIPVDGFVYNELYPVLEIDHSSDGSFVRTISPADNSAFLIELRSFEIICNSCDHYVLFVEDGGIRIVHALLSGDQFWERYYDNFPDERAAVRSMIRGNSAAYSPARM